VQPPDPGPAVALATRAGVVFPDEASPLLPAFDTGSTTAAIGNRVLAHRITPQWFVSAGAVHFRCRGDLKDSPILLDRSQTGGFTAVGCIWGWPPTGNGGQAAAPAGRRRNAPRTRPRHCRLCALVVYSPREAVRDRDPVAGPSR